MTTTKTLFASAALLALLPAHATISVGSAAFTYAQNYDALAQTGSANTWVNDSTINGFSLFNSAGAAITAYAADNGASNTGSFYSFGTTSSSDRALGSTASGGAYFGSPASGAPAGFVAVAFTNTSGVALAGFTLGYDGEQWRNGGNTSAQSLTVDYGFGASYTAAVFGAPVAALTFTSPVVGATGAAVDGNTAGRVANISATVTQPWAAGQTLWVRWTDLNDVGNDHGLAIDNLSFSVTAVPEPGSWALMLAGLAATGFLLRRRA